MPKRKGEEEGAEAVEEPEPLSTAKPENAGEDTERDDTGEKEEKKAPAKKKKKLGDGSGVSNKIELGKNKFVDVREFKGMVLVDIREYYEKDGEMRPGKKGIALSAPQWQVLKENMAEITSKIEEFAD